MMRMKTVRADMIRPEGRDRVGRSSVNLTEGTTGCRGSAVICTGQGLKQTCTEAIIASEAINPSYSVLCSHIFSTADTVGKSNQCVWSVGWLVASLFDQ